MENGRLLKELREIDTDSRCGVKVELVDGKLDHMTGTIHGPASSPYEGGTFVVDIQLPAAYPFEPPKMRFVTKVWHPNVSSASGAICLDVLKEAWSPALTLKTALLSVQALLASPEPDDPQDAVVARQYITQRALFLQTARHWAVTYGGAPGDDGGAHVEAEAKVQRLAEMGFDIDAVRAALATTGGDESAALERLCG